MLSRVHSPLRRIVVFFILVSIWFSTCNCTGIGEFDKYFRSFTLFGIEQTVRQATIDDFFVTAPGNYQGSNISVLIASNGADVWAISYSFLPDTESMAEYNGIYVWRIYFDERGHHVKFVFCGSQLTCFGFTTDVYEYDNKYVVCGIVGTEHWDPGDYTDSGVTIDISRRKLLLIENDSNTVGIPIDDTKLYCGYIAVLDYEPVDIVLLDHEHNELLRMSDTPIRITKVPPVPIF